MTGFRAVFLREISSGLATLASWTTLAIGAFLLALVFILLVLIPSGPVTLQPVISTASWILILVVPAFAMRSFSEERRQGTWEILQSAPVSALSIVLGKFFGTLVQLILLGVMIVLFGLVLEIHGRPDWGEIGCGLLGLLLVGCGWLALGMLASTLTDSQLVSYLLALFASLAIVLCARMLPSVLPEEWGALLFAIDPTRRSRDFAIGLLDTGNVAYFVLATVGLLWLTMLSASRRPGVGLDGVTIGRRILEVVGVVVAVVATIALFDLPSLRSSFDLTRTRAYALDARTLELLEELPGEKDAWSIHVLAVESENDEVVLRQVDEVLERFDESSDQLTAQRIDPLDPASLSSFEGLLERLRVVYAEDVSTFENTLQEARLVYSDLIGFAVEVLPSLRELVATLPPGDPMTEQVTGLARALTRLSAEGGELEAYVERGLRADGSRPIPDHEGVRTALQTTVAFWSEQLAATSRLLQEWSASPEQDPSIRRWALNARPLFEDIAIELAMAADELDQLEPLALSEVSRAIQGGEAAIVIGPDVGAAVVPSWQLFPRRTLNAGDGTVRLDRRFRGEEVLAGALRSLQLSERPWVVFVHAEDRRMLQLTENGSDLFALSDVLQAARYEVAEWNVTGGERPIAPTGTRAVWVVVPPLSREGLELSDSEQKLLTATQSLIEGGEPVLLSLARSILPVVGREDPWQALAESLGVSTDTSRVVMERVVVDEDTFETQQWQQIPAPVARVSHPLIEGVGSQTLMILQPIALGAGDPDATRTLWEIEPSSSRWLEEEWRTEVIEQRAEVPEGGRFTESLPVVVAVERINPDGQMQRALVVGGSGWLLSAVADLSRSLGGERRILEAPGNRALMLAGAAWLAGLDELVPESGGVSGMSRIVGVNRGVRIAWGIVFILLIPLCVLTAGGIVAFSRRRA